MRLVLPGVLALCACHHAPPAQLDVFAARFVDDARATTIPADTIDEGLISRVHHAQKVKMAAQGGAPADILGKIWRDESDRHGSAGERADQQRERAASALKRTLHGVCKVEVDDAGAPLRVGALSDPPPTAPDEVKAGFASLRQDLDGAKVVRVSCEVGTIGLLAVPRSGSWKVVDLFQVGTGPKMDLKPSPH